MWAMIEKLRIRLGSVAMAGPSERGVERRVSIPAAWGRGEAGGPAMEAFDGPAPAGSPIADADRVQNQGADLEQEADRRDHERVAGRVVRLVDVVELVHRNEQAEPALKRVVQKRVGDDG